MPKTFSLRGVYEVADNASGFVTSIFDYVSPDRQRAWKIKEAWVWPRDIRATTESQDGQGVLQATLYTDSWTPPHHTPNFEWISNTADNRQCGWSTRQFVLRYDAGAPANHFICPANPDDGQFILDPDTIIVKELYIQMCFTTESDTNPTRGWNYLIILEEKKISPAESVLQQVKGMGQNVSD
jgi:hypothetical protein